MPTVLDIIPGNYFRAVLVVALGVVPLLIVLQLFRTYWRLRHIPGPFSATFSNLQRVLWVKTRQAHFIHQHVHEQYGPVVGTGPNMVMFDDPDAIPIIHTMRRGFPKSPFYNIFKSYTPDGGRNTVFNATDAEALKKIKSPVAPLFSATNAMALEPIIDEVLACFAKNVDKRYLQQESPQVITI